MNETERYLFHFPASDWEYQIAAAATLRSFEKTLSARKDDYQFFVMGIEGGSQFLFEAFEREVVCFDRGQSDKPHEMFDVEFHFDIARAKLLAEQQKLHVTAAFGIMLGVWQSQQLPELVIPGVDLPERPRILLARDFPWDGWDDLEDIIQTNVNDVDLVKLEDPAPADYTLHNVFDLAVNNQFIVGVRSPLTYLAASIGRRVLEFYPVAEMTTEWLTKSNSRSYTMLAQQGDVKHRATLVWRLLKESLWLTVK